MIRRYSPTPRRAAFTLIELLAVIVIIALLASLLVPTFKSMLESGYQTKCMNNLRMIFASANAAAQDNNNAYPLIENTPKTPYFPTSAGAKTMLQAFQPYGLNVKSLQCPTDMERGNQSDYAQYQSSYFWYPFVQPTSTNQTANQTDVTVTVYTRRGGFPRKLSKVQLAADWEGLHLVYLPAQPANGVQPAIQGGFVGRFNVVYADGHLLPFWAQVPPKH